MESGSRASPDLKLSRDVGSGGEEYHLDMGGIVYLKEESIILKNTKITF
jgi:hypothetical protein